MTTPANERTTNLIWIDLEMTGLCTLNDRIVEIATIVTDKYLNELAEGPVLAINQSQETMDGMDEWNTRQHGNSGLMAGDTRCYQWWYRDPGASNPCQSDFFNLSNAVSVTWAP